MVYVTGDMHGDIQRFDNPALKKLKKGDTLLICGDFGFLWSGNEAEQKNLKKLSKKKYTIAFVDGTHENFDLLNQYEVTQWNGGNVHALSENLFHLMRGQVFVIDGISFFTMGGGISADREMREDHVSWWKNEMPSKEELLAGADSLDRLNGEVDVVITHEAPATTKEFLRLKTKEWVRVTALNNYLEQLGKTVSYKKWYFGSLHIDKPVTGNLTSVFREILPIDLSGSK